MSDFVIPHKIYIYFNAHFFLFSEETCETALSESISPTKVGILFVKISHFPKDSYYLLLIFQKCNATN